MQSDCLTDGNLWLRVAGAGAARRGQPQPVTSSEREPVAATSSSAHSDQESAGNPAERAHR